MGHTQSTVVVIRVGSFETSDLPLTTKLSHAFNDNLGESTNPMYHNSKHCNLLHPMNKYPEEKILDFLYRFHSYDFF